ncbi:Alpha-L-arabinofuranosidase-like protein [Fimbriiglobus ruber]|uniref:Alpha-L-arabinofuranosidase-like protein n=1 Tax=Fimbriiglobus ruber TaxID=1908690 RepID=A0A225E6J1_9BACT|nr:Alpha-L-arabinofuranosidase-like protein [Fimbriiglobus ruber]
MTVNVGQVVNTLNDDVIGVNLTNFDNVLSSGDQATAAPDPGSVSLLSAAGFHMVRLGSGGSTDSWHFYQENQAPALPYYDSGAGELANTAAAIGADALVTFNYGTGTPQEAAAYLAYLNGDPDSTFPIGTDSNGVDWGTAGYWATLRGESPVAGDPLTVSPIGPLNLNMLRAGHPAPFGFHDFEVGNEAYYHAWTNGNSSNPSAYAGFAATVATLAAGIDPDARIGIDFADPGNSADPNSLENTWNVPVLAACRAAGFTPGFVDDHLYLYDTFSEAPLSDQALLTQTVSDTSSTNPETNVPINWATRAADDRAELNAQLGAQAAGVQLLAGEFNADVNADSVTQSTALTNGLLLADAIGSIIQTEYQSLTFWDFRNFYNDPAQSPPAGDTFYGWRTGSDQGMVGSDNPNAPPGTGPDVPYPTYFAEELASKLGVTGDSVVAAQTDNPLVSVYAVAQQSGHLALLMINKSSTAADTAAVSVTGFAPAAGAELWQYGEAEDTAQENSADGSAALNHTTPTLSVTGGQFSITLPAYSMSVLVLSPAPAAPPTPTVTRVSPPSGPVAGGTTVTITGTNLVGATAVQFGGTGAAIVSDMATQIVATSPAGSAGSVDVTVTTTAGTSLTSAADVFTYVAPPAVTDVGPASGPDTGGTTVTISGTDLAGATGLAFGGTLATIASDTATQIVATSPAGMAGPVDVIVTTAAGTSATSAADVFTYISSAVPPVVPPVVPPTVPPVTPPVPPVAPPTPPTVPPVVPPAAPPTVPPAVPPITPPTVPPPVPPVVPPLVPPVVPPSVPSAVPPVVPPPVPPTVSQGPNAALVGIPQFAVGADAGGPGSVTVYNPDQSVAYVATPFGASFTDGVRVAVADLTGDGVPDLVAGTGQGVSNQVVVVDGKTQQQIVSFHPFEMSFTGGVFVTLGDLNGDGVPDLIVTPDQSGGPVVAVYDGAALGKGIVTQLARFLGINDPSFRGGARAAVGDVNGDGVGDLIVSAGFGGGPRVAIYDGKSVARNAPSELLPDFFAFETSLRNGVYVTAGDLTGAGYADLIFGAGPGGGPRVRAVDSKQLLAAGDFSSLDNASVAGAGLADFFAGDPSSRGGVRVAVKNLDGDEKADLVTGSGTGSGAQITTYTGAALTAAPNSPAAGLDFDALPGFTGGVFVG